MKVLIAVVLAYLACSQGREVGIRQYKGYKVYSCLATTPEQYQVLWDVYTTTTEGSFDFWSKPAINSKTDVMVPPAEEASFLGMLAQAGISYTIKVEDVQELLDEEKTENEEERSRAGTKVIGWTSYARFSEIESFMQSLPALNSMASVESIGKSTEGRDIYAVKISNSPNNNKAIIIDANIHAREWITSATATWVINEFVTKTSDYAASHLNGIDYYILPNINPDGYEYSHTNDRMWRKTRSTNSGSTCRGCDPNRNFPFQFGGEGTSSNPCSDTFRGKAALSEPETKAVSEYINKLKNSGVNLKAYISFHSYGQLWLLPWGYTAGAYPEDYADQLSLGTDVINAIRGVSSTRYVTGTGADVLYGVGGASDDWAKSVGIKYTVTAEMRDQGRYGFALPANQIIANAQEIMAGLKVVADRIRTEA